MLMRKRLLVVSFLAFLYTKVSAGQVKNNKKKVKEGQLQLFVLVVNDSDHKKFRIWASMLNPLRVRRFDKICSFYEIFFESDSTPSL